MVPLHENPSQIPSSEIPVQILTQIPSQIPVQIPTQIPIQIPIQVPTQIPIQNSIQTPIQNLNIAPRLLCWDNYILATRSVFGGCLCCLFTPAMHRHFTFGG